MELHTIGIDLGKTVFHLVGLDLRGEVVVRKKFSRTQLLRFTANVHVRLIGMEACGGSHFLGRALREQRHEVRLIPAQYVKRTRATISMPRRSLRLSHGRRCVSCRSRLMTSWICSPCIACASVG
jgi:transposase